MLEALYGQTITNSDGRIVPVRLIGEQHVLEDLGHIPSFATGRGRSAPSPGCCAAIRKGSPGLDPTNTPA